MGQNGKRKAGPWHGLVIDVDNCCSLLDQSSGTVPSLGFIRGEGSGT